MARSHRTQHGSWNAELTIVASEPAASDSDRLHALRLGDDSALNDLMARWQRPLFAFAWRYVQNTADAHDVVAETFVRLYRQREKLRPDTRLSAWLFTTLANLCHNLHRWRRRHPTVSLDDPLPGWERSPREELPEERASPSGELEGSERRQALLAAIDQLPHDMKTALLLYHFEDMPYRAIANVLGCSERGIETRIYRAKQRLRKTLGPWAAGTGPPPSARNVEPPTASPAD